MNYLKLTSDKLDVGVLSELVAHESCGAVSLFVGTTRDNFEDKTVLCLEYEAYEAMALKSMNSICSEIRLRWTDVKHIGMHHRLGVVPVKEASVVIAISSPHRKSSLQAVQYAIEELKKSVPVWKKETYSDPAASRKRKMIGNSSSSCTTPAKKLHFRTAANLNFDDCKVIDSQIPKNLIQINADSSEIERRLNCFVEKKREEIDNNNIQDFIVRKDNDQADEFSCARVNSIIFRQKDSKGHLRVHRVKNEFGPQTDFNYKSALDKLMETKGRFNDGSSVGDTTGVEERLMNIESHLKLAGTNNFAKATVFERLKVIENKILLLETISPEYAHFLERTPRHVKPASNKVVYSNDDVDELMERLQSQVAEQKE